MRKIIILLSSTVIFIFIILTTLLYNIDNTKEKKEDNNLYAKINYYKKENYERYKKYKNENKKLSDEDIITRVNLNLDKSPYTNTNKAKNLNTNYILVNKYNYLEENYIPNNLELLSSSYSKNGIYLVKEAKENLERLITKSREDGMNIRVISAYRSYTYQKNLYNNYVKKDGVKNADTYSARPGFSEHQTGLVIDVTKAFDDYNNFFNTEEYKWMLENAEDYGFILRYPKNKEDITKYNFEAWHYRYVGINLAKEINKRNLTLDEYYIKFIDINN